MKNRIRTLKESGFSHIEIMLTVLVVALVVLAGVLVYSKNNTTHAGSLAYIGQAKSPIGTPAQTGTAYACALRPKNSTIWTVESTFDMSNSWNSKDGKWNIGILDSNIYYAKYYAKYVAQKIAYPADTAPSITHLNLQVQTNKTDNYLTFRMTWVSTTVGALIYPNGGSNLNASYVRPYNLPNC